MKEIYYVYVLQNVNSGSFQVTVMCIKPNSPVKISGSTSCTRLIIFEQHENKTDAYSRKEYFESKEGHLFLRKSIKNLFVEAF
jgi:hypothetical protein